MDIWKPEEKPHAIEEGVVEVKGANSMPYLDAKIIFNKNEQPILEFTSRKTITQNMWAEGACTQKNA